MGATHTRSMPDPRGGHHVLLMKVDGMQQATVNYTVLVPTMYWQLDLCLPLPLGRALITSTLGAHLLMLRKLANLTVRHCGDG